MEGARPLLPGVPGRDRRAERRRLRGAAAACGAGGHGRRTAVRPPARRRLPGLHTGRRGDRGRARAGRPHRGRRRRRACLLVPRGDRHPDPPIRRTVRRCGGHRAGDSPSRGGRRDRRGVARAAHVRGTCSDRPRAPPSPRGGRRPVERARRRGATAGSARRIVVARAGRLRRSPRAPRERHGPHGGARDVPLRVGAPVVDRRRRSARAAHRISAHIRPGQAVAGGGARADARGTGDRRHGGDGHGAHRWPHAGRGVGGRDRARGARSSHDRLGPVGAGRVPHPLAGPAVLGETGRRSRSFIRRPARDRRRGRPFRRGRRGRRVARPVHGGIRPRARCRRARARVPQHGSRVVRRRTGVDGARCRRHRARHGHRRGDRRRELPQLVPPGTDVRPGRARTADLAVRAQPCPSGGRTSAVPHDGRSREDTGGADRERDARRRVGRRVEVRRRARRGVDADPPRPVRRAGLGTGGDRHVAAHARGP